MFTRRVPKRTYRQHLWSTVTLAPSVRERSTRAQFLHSHKMLADRAPSVPERCYRRDFMTPMEKPHNGERLNLEVAARALRRFLVAIWIFVGAGFRLLRKRCWVSSVRLDSRIAGRWPYPEILDRIDSILVRALSIKKRR